MLKKFNTFLLANNFYQEMTKVKAPTHLKDQLLRASSSVALNLAEGSAKFSLKDQSRFYQIAYGSMKESIAILHLINYQNKDVERLSFHLSCSIRKLIDSRK